MTPEQWRETVRRRDAADAVDAVDRDRLLRRAHRAVRLRLLRAWVVAAIAAVVLFAAAAALPVAEVPVDDGADEQTTDDDVDDTSEVDDGPDDGPVDDETDDGPTDDGPVDDDAPEPVLLLTVAVSRGPGVIVVDPGTEECRFECEYRLPRGTSVTLRAEEREDSTFVGWLGDECPDTPTCSFTLTDDTAISALFREPVPLTITIDCSAPVATDDCGAVRVTPGEVVCPTTCEPEYRLGSELTLTPHPAPGYHVVGWRGACTEAATPEDRQPACAVTMDQATSVTAVFQGDID